MSEDHMLDKEFSLFQTFWWTKG